MRQGRTRRGLRAAALFWGASSGASLGVASSFVACFVSIDDTKLHAQDAGSADASSADASGADAGDPSALTYMIGYGGGGTSDTAIATFEAALGRPLDIVLDTLTVDGFEFGPFHSASGRPMGKILEVEMLSSSFDANKNLTDMAKAASGAYDDVYTLMAKSISGFADPIVSVRIGFDMNGNWQPWSAYDGNTHNASTANYIATFKRMAKLFRQYSPSTLIEWSVTLEAHGVPWPGDTTTPLDYWVGAYDPNANPGGADVVSMSFHESAVGTNFVNDVRGGPWGLDWLARFAHDNHVRIALSDVATGLDNSPGQGGGCPCSNDAAWMQQMVDWIDGLPAGQFTHLAFSPWTPVDDLLAPGNASLFAVWTKRYRPTHFAGAWWTGAKVPSQR